MPCADWLKSGLDQSSWEPRVESRAILQWRVSGLDVGVIAMTSTYLHSAPWGGFGCDLVVEDTGFAVRET